MRSFYVPGRFAFVLACGLLTAGEACAATVESPKQTAGATSASNQSADSSSVLNVEVINGTSRVTKNFEAQTAMPSRTPANGCGSRKLRLMVMNGQSKRAACFDRVPSTSAEVPRNGVVILNGTQKETRIFSAKAEKNGPKRNLPPVVIGIATGGSKSLQGRRVVVGILSSGSASSAMNARPVVIDVASSESPNQSGSEQRVVVGIASSGSQTAGAAEPVAVGIAPRPEKRHPYRPAALDAQ